MSEVVAGVRGLLEDRVGRIGVIGEISNLRLAGSGHAYFTLKDDTAQLRAALFRSDARRIPFDLEDGLEVVAVGDVTLYEARGDLQILVRHLEPRGRGALQLAFEQLRARLEREGLFDPAAKRALPPVPRALAVVTSASGAALRDVIQIAGRASCTPLYVVPTRVQGEGAEHEIAAALDLASLAAARFALDAILLVRGGGSLEDLQPFNTEVVARAILRASVPVVSGVGHETDVTIADLAADLRAPTPSAAAALALPDCDALRARLARDRRLLASTAGRAVARFAARLGAQRERLRALAPAARLAAQRARAEALARALPVAARRAVDRSAAGLHALAGRLDSLSPLAVLGRGYAIVWRADGSVLRSARECAPGDPLRVRVQEGEVRAEVSEIVDLHSGSR